MRSGAILGTGIRLWGAPIISRAENSEILIEDRVTLVSSPRWTALGVGRPTILRTLLAGAEIKLGEDSGFSGVTICSTKSVRIGSRVLCGADVLISDSDFHPVDEIPRTGAPIPLGRAQDAVKIGDDVFVGARSIVLKGVEIGDGSVIGAGSVVTSDIPKNVIAAGNPARVIRQLRR
ncbi:acyltransferase [Arthrobacter crystallopoietes]|uniref:acyltransferase n=1 Tax=Crystallibacter crystallopoietes TaxID=37928 RepID=UPI00196A9F72|nr:acyltransferase [Arthrobacter crystallopoietes]